ncbi:MAG: protein kinase, partial [Candidatus Accumulibacter sp.]|nr:protein kinase [Accumulibacter sp.]
MHKIGRYDLIRILGSGTTSTVYLGRDPFAKRDVAIKLAFPEILKHPERGKLYTQLFKNEASLAGRLDHPHIVQIYDAVVSDDLCYIVTEYVKGGTLQECCNAQRRLPVDSVVEIILKCARALEFAHGIGVTHRDIKPANILYAGDTPGEAIKISDFGAAIVDSPDRTLVSGIGSPAYMSPEQLRELPLDHRTDIYSLGVVMYQLLTGQLPFQASDGYGIVYQIFSAAPPPPSRLREGIPPALDAVIARAMRRDRQERYAAWEEFAADLKQAALGLDDARAGDEPSEIERFEALRELDFFADFSDEEIAEVLPFAEWNTVPAGRTVLRDGEGGDFFCFVLAGRLGAAKGGSGRPPRRLTPGDCFGELAVIGKAAPMRDGDITALTEATIVTVRGEALREASETCRMHFYQAFSEIL